MKAIDPRNVHVRNASLETAPNHPQTIEGLKINRPWHWLAFVAAVFHPIFGSVMGALPFISPLFQGNHAYFFGFWVTVVVAEWTVALAIVACLLANGAGVSAVGIEPPQPKILILLIVIALVLAAIVIRMPARSTSGPAPPFLTLPRTHAERWFMLFLVAPTAAVCEETIYRGFLLRFLTTLIGLWPAIIVQALLFAYMHGGFYQPLFLFVNGSVLGFLLALLVNWRGNLRAAMAVHFLIDGVQLTLAP